MGMQRRLLNWTTSVRSLASMFPGFYPRLGGEKHNYHVDFGYPETLTFEHFYLMYMRNGIAEAGVKRTTGKTWQTLPQISTTNDPEAETPDDIQAAFKRLRFWQKLKKADERGMVGGYAGFILRIADGLTFDQPVDGTTYSLDDLVEVVPAWAGQLTVSSWDENQTSETYGEPLMFSFNEAAVGTQKKARSFVVHPDRVIIWSEDGTVHAKSDLYAGYNALMDAEKVCGAGGEGFWKNSRSNPVLEMDPEMQIGTMANAMGVEENEVVDAMHKSVEEYQKGFDKAMLLQGIEAKFPGISLPSNPADYFNIPVMVFAASLQIPIKILLGSQTGERASTEDASEWAKTCMARRENETIPNIQKVIKRLAEFGMIADVEWFVAWDDLTEASMSDKLERGTKMTDVNQKAVITDGQPIFTSEEIREASGYDDTLPEAMDLDNPELGVTEDDVDEGEDE